MRERGFLGIINFFYLRKLQLSVIKVSQMFNVSSNSNHIYLFHWNQKFPSNLSQSNKSRIYTFLWMFLKIIEKYSYTYFLIHSTLRSCLKDQTKIRLERSLICDSYPLIHTRLKKHVARKHVLYNFRYSANMLNIRTHGFDWPCTILVDICWNMLELLNV